MAMVCILQQVSEEVGAIVLIYHSSKEKENTVSKGSVFIKTLSYFDHVAIEKCKELHVETRLQFKY